MTQISLPFAAPVEREAVVLLVLEQETALFEGAARLAVQLDEHACVALQLAADRRAVEADVPRASLRFRARVFEVHRVLPVQHHQGVRLGLRLLGGSLGYGFTGARSR